MADVTTGQREQGVPGEVSDTSGEVPAEGEQPTEAISGVLNVTRGTPT